MTKEDSQGICGTCQGPASLKCTACGNVYYCSKEHQKKHWKIHKKECFPVVEQKDQQQGRYLVASRDIPAGHLILKEKPIVLGPPSISTAMCLGCLNPITQPDFPKCPRCSWPLCSPVCAESPLHAGECAYLSTDTGKKCPPQNLEETPRYDVILVLRCLALREKKPDAWKTIESMVNYAEKYKKEEEPYHMATVKYISEILTGVCDADLVHKVRGAIITNAINTKGPKGQSFRGMYPKIYLLNHSCHPNVTLRSDIYGFLYINAAVDIKKGDPLLFSYISPSLPLWQRQEELQMNYNFICTCVRCTDPTELATYFSNPKCPKCHDSFLEPSQNYKDAWKCSKCGTTKPLKDLIKMADKFMENIEAKSATVKDAAELLDNVNKDYHPKHYVWLTAAQAILRNLASNNEIEALLIKRDLWESIVQLFFKLEPGTTRRRGVSLYHLACAEFEVFKAKKLLKQLSPSEYLAVLTNVLYRLDSAKEIITLEAEDSFERRWLKLLEEEREKINKIKEKLEES
ncbi:SET domain-containing protein SmydA-8-like [Palaemon carinicauda]|uniref:SET domain-containing protein SmydA-8-like n=1 Tax=Palaemon carinicauda TaxID=392227 RepID=UPI0035B67570